MGPPARRDAEDMTHWLTPRRRTALALVGLGAATLIAVVGLTAALGTSAFLAGFLANLLASVIVAGTVSYYVTERINAGQERRAQERERHEAARDMSVLVEDIRLLFLQPPIWDLERAVDTAGMYAVEIIRAARRYPIQTWRGTLPEHTAFFERLATLRSVYAAFQAEATALEEVYRANLARLAEQGAPYDDLQGHVRKAALYAVAAEVSTEQDKIWACQALGFARDDRRALDRYAATARQMAIERYRAGWLPDSFARHHRAVDEATYAVLQSVLEERAGPIDAETAAELRRRLQHISPTPQEPDPRLEALRSVLRAAPAAAPRRRPGSGSALAARRRRRSPSPPSVPPPPSSAPPGDPDAPPAPEQG